MSLRASASRTLPRADGRGQPRRLVRCDRILFMQLTPRHTCLEIHRDLFLSACTCHQFRGPPRPAASRRAGRSLTSSAGRCRRKTARRSPRTRNPATPRRVLARRAAAKVATGEENPAPLMIELEVGILAPVIEEQFAETRALDPLEELLWDDLVSVDVVAVEDDRGRCHAPEPLSCRDREVALERGRGCHFGTDVSGRRRPGGLRSCGSTSRRIVRRRRAHRVHAEAHREAGAPPLETGSRDTRSRPSASACAFTRAEPGTNIARTFRCTCFPRTTAAASARRAHARVRARADEDAIDRDISDPHSWLTADICKRALSRLVGRLGYDVVARHDHSRVCRPRHLRFHGRGAIVTSRSKTASVSLGSLRQRSVDLGASGA